MAFIPDSRWVVNASPLICLGKIGRLDLLTGLTEECLIPDGVAAEILAGPSGDAARSWVSGTGTGHIRPAAPLDPLIVA